MATATDDNGKPKASAPKSPRHKPVEVDWDAIRRDYERFGGSVKGICARFGFKSRNTVNRMIAKQGWKRDMSSIADRIATNTVSFHEAVQVGASTRGDLQSRRPVVADAMALLGVTDLPEPRPIARSRPSRAKAAVAARATAQAEQEADIKHARTYPPAPNPQSRDANTMLAVLNLAQRQAVVRSQEVDGGDQMIGLGRSIMAALAVLIDPDATEAERAVEKRRLRQLNPDKDGLVSLAKIGAVLVDGGARMKRRAFAMDAKGLDPEDTGMEPAIGAAKLILQGLPADVLMQIRKAAYEVSKLPKQPALPKPETV